MLIDWVRSDSKVSFGVGRVEGRLLDDEVSIFDAIG